MNHQPVVAEVDDVVHIKLTLTKASDYWKPPFPMNYEERVEAFHIAAKKADPDWPFAFKVSEAMEENFVENPVCEHCGGILYMNPNIGPREISCLANQLGLTVTHLRYVANEDCDVLSRIPSRTQTKALLPTSEKTLVEEVLTPTTPIEAAASTRVELSENVESVTQPPSWARPSSWEECEEYWAETRWRHC